MMDRDDRTQGEEIRCRNCGRTAGPRFCAHCGQEVEERRGPVLTVLREVLSDWLSLDSRLLRSLRALLVPGRLTGLHLDGKRAPYMRPFRLYLLASLVLFSTVLALEGLDATDWDVYVAGELVSDRSAAEGEAKRELEILGSKTALERWIVAHEGEKIERLRALPPQEIVDLFFSTIRRFWPAALILFVPFLALAVQLLYLRSHALYLDHLVFALHFQSALFFALGAIWLLAKIFRFSAMTTLFACVLAFLGMLTVYLFLALRRLHRQSRWLSAVKTLVLVLIYLQLLSSVLSAVWLGVLRQL